MENSILLIGESGVGKTHYGAQLLKRLMKADGHLRMRGAATNLQPFESAMESLNEGKAAGHTPTSTFVDSVWPIVDGQGNPAELVWPDYGGEQIRNMTSVRRVPSAWRSRVASTPSWLLLVRLQQTRLGDDVFSRPLHHLNSTAGEQKQEVQISDQARLVELLQMLLYIRGSGSSGAPSAPQLCVLLSCWDELGTDAKIPLEVLSERLPLLSSFIASNWPEVSILGLSALERPLDRNDRDLEYAAIGPENFGYVILPNGERSPDLTLPVRLLLAGGF
jgi:hypothetical protein